MALLILALLIGSMLAASQAQAFSISSFSLSDSTLAAGAHPDLTTKIGFSSVMHGGTLTTEDNVRNLAIDLPAGLMGDPHATPQCTSAQLTPASPDPNDIVPVPSPTCSVDAQVGVVTLHLASLPPLVLPVYNMVPSSPTQTARFGFYLPIPALLVNIAISVRTGSDYGLTARIDNISRLDYVLGADLTLWGVPAAAEHDSLRFPPGYLARSGQFPLPPTNSVPSGATPAPLLTNPTTCGGPLVTVARADSYQHPGVYDERESETATGVQGCDALGFRPTISIRPTSVATATPSGYAIDVAIPQTDNPAGRATSQLRDTTVTLPRGVTISPGAADGLLACDDAQLKLGTTAAAECPDGSKLGTVSFDVPALAGPLTGGIYLGRPEPGNLYRLWLVGDGYGVHVKIPGTVRPDPVTGQLVTTFLNSPQVPLSAVHLRFFGGARAVLSNPRTCGSYTARASFASWAGQVAKPFGEFDIDQECGNDSKFTPGFEAGTANPVAGRFSPFTLRVTRPGGQRNVSTIEARLPKGLLAKLAGVPLCPDGDAASGNCPASSQVGRVVVGVGSGGNPLYIPQPGKASTAVYLAGPYRGGPYSLVARIPAQAGPFDLGTVVVRNALYVDPSTAQVTARSDALPQILEGIPINYRDIRVEVNRPEFTVNPTNCEPTQVAGAIGSTEGGSADVSDRFQVGDCAALRFKPRLRLSLKGATGRTGHPGLKAAVTYPKKGRYANIARAQVGLPHSEFLDQSNLNKVCKQADLKAGTCPKSSIYGWAKAWTPLLSEPLQGPVYLGVGYGYKLPALVADLNGQIRVLLVGRIDTTRHNGIRNTFEVVPDAPVSRFELRLKGGKKYGLLENSESLCKKKQRASALFNAENGLRLHMRPRIANSCGKAHKHKRKARRHTRRRNK